MYIDLTCCFFCIHPSKPTTAGIRLQFRNAASLLAILFVTICSTRIYGQSASVAASTDYFVGENGPHHRIWKSVCVQTNEAGAVIYRTNLFTELATGLNHLANGEWVASSEDIQLTSNGGAATNTQHQVFFSANINTPGSIDLITSSGRHLTGTVLGLSLCDSATGQNAIIAQLQNSIGEILPVGNQVLYTNALVDSGSDFEADVLYTHKKGGFEQDIVLHQQPPSPASLNLNPDTTMLQIWTEFYNTADPETSTNAIAVACLEAGQPGRKILSSENLDFGAMRMDQGNAFMSSSLTNLDAAATGGLLLLPVTKHWIKQDRRRFLVEEIPYNSIVEQVSVLPAPVPSSGATGPGDSPQSFFRGPSKSIGQQAKSQSLRIAKNNHPSRPGLVLDYTLNNNVTNFTFRSDQTYYVSGPLNLYSNTTVEGGTVIKSATTTSGTTIVNGDVKWLTAPYRPAIFTCTNDNSVGVTLPGATGTPVYGSTTYLYCPNGGSITNVRFSYAANAYSAGAGDVEITDCQFIKCSHPISVNTGTSKLGLHNVLITMDNTYNSGGWAITLYSSGLAFSGEHITADLASQTFLQYTYYQLSSFSLTNSIIISPHLTNCTSGTSTATISTNAVYYSATASPSLFQSVGAGNYYLATSSPLRGLGTTNINTNVLADIQRHTTFPPVFITNTLTADAVFVPLASRDTNSTLDLGYHYDPLDYLSGCTVTNASLLLTNGVALGYYSVGITLRDGGQLISQGTPLERNYLAHVNLVQEQSTNIWYTNALSAARPIDFSVTNSNRAPSISMRMTTISAQNSVSTLFQATDSGELLNSLNLRDCEIYAAGGMWSVTATNSPIVALIQNNVVHRAYAFLIESPALITTYNNLFIGTGSIPSDFNIVDFAHTGTGTNYDSHFNNAFNGLVSSLDGTYSHSAYLNGASTLSTLQTSDIVTNLTWLTGPLGSYYQAFDSPLTNKGNTTADLLGLYHYTTQTSQTKETNSLVDIGYHYVALNSSGLPVDSNGDGVPDYLQDTAGNGQITITLIFPLNNSYYAEPANIPMQAVVSDWSGLVTNVEIFVGANRLMGLNTMPYMYSWPIVAAGSYSLTAVGHDSGGINVTSPPITTQVTNYCTP